MQEGQRFVAAIGLAVVTFLVGGFAGYLGFVGCGEGHFGDACRVIGSELSLLLMAAVPAFVVLGVGLIAQTNRSPVLLLMISS